MSATIARVKWLVAPTSEAWLAAWCEVLSKSRRGVVRNPAAVLRWLLDHPKALAEYPSQASEDKARSILLRMAAGV